MTITSTPVAIEAVFSLIAQKEDQREEVDRLYRTAIARSTELEDEIQALRMQVHNWAAEQVASQRQANR